MYLLMYTLFWRELEDVTELTFYFLFFYCPNPKVPSHLVLSPGLIWRFYTHTHTVACVCGTGVCCLTCSVTHDGVIHAREMDVQSHTEWLSDSHQGWEWPAVTLLLSCRLKARKCRPGLWVMGLKDTDRLYRQALSSVFLALIVQTSV